MSKDLERRILKAREKLEELRESSYTRKYKRVMLNAYAWFLKENGVNKVSRVDRWRKALELMDKFGIPFSVGMLPYLDEELCKELGKTREELMGMLISFEEWEVM